MDKESFTVFRKQESGEMPCMWQHRCECGGTSFRTKGLANVSVLFMQSNRAFRWIFRRVSHKIIMKRVSAFLQIPSLTYMPGRFGQWLTYQNDESLREMLFSGEDREASGAAVLRLLAQADREIKDVLTQVFGQENDFDKLLGGVNLLAVAGNGQRVISNLLEALQPIMVAGAESCARQQVDGAVEQARLNRAQRRGLA